MAESKPRCVLTVAGLDSSGGAGLVADAAAVNMLALNVAVACTAITVQTPGAVVRIEALPPDLVADQIRSAFDAYDVASAKTGMLANAEVVQAVAEALENLASPDLKLVVDPVVSAASGRALLTEEGVSRLRELLLPMAYVATPNLSEAALLTGLPVETVEQMKEAALAIHQLGARNVVVTGGHLAERAVDVLFDGRDFQELAARRLPGGVHGSGCTYSASLAAYLARGAPLHKAAAGAKRAVERRIEEGL